MLSNLGEFAVNLKPPPPRKFVFFRFRPELTVTFVEQPD